MPRTARIVIPGAIHHVTQRGSRNQQTFFCPEDYVFYRDLLASRCAMKGVELLQYCLMPNHVHLLLRPADSSGLSAALRDTHCAYARAINARYGWTGHFWQSRFWSHAIFGTRILMVMRYVAQNPLRKALVPGVEAWQPSSAADLLDLRIDPWLSGRELRGYMDSWDVFLATIPPSAETDLIRQHLRSGEPLSPYSETRKAG
ncbi:MAG: transposase [Planctomycetota bacterium]|jgi:putative transposase